MLEAPSPESAAGAGRDAGVAAVPSTSRHGLCSVCSLHAAKYTCPRCEAKTCSLDCTKTHKAATSCSGERDRVSYIGMNQYGDVGMWRDLSYLRDVKTKAAEWGKLAQAGSGKPSYKGKEREKEGQVMPERLLNLSPKEQHLKKQMILRGVEVLFLPKEMEKHKQNKSHWQNKKRKLNLTVSVTFYNRDGQKHHTTTTHYNDLAAELQDLVAAVPQEKRPGEAEETFTVLLAVPARPTTYVPPNAQPIMPDRGGSKKEEQGLAPAPSSLPAKPAWVPEVPADEPVMVEEEEHEEVETVPLPYSLARQVWQVSLQTGDRPTTLQEALRGTSILEWPDFELWPSALVHKLVEEGRLEFMTRREPEDRRNRGEGGSDQSWAGRKRMFGEVEDPNGEIYGADEQAQDHEEGGPELDELEAAIASDNLHLAQA